MLTRLHARGQSGDAVQLNEVRSRDLLAVRQLAQRAGENDCKRRQLAMPARKTLLNTRKKQIA